MIHLSLNEISHVIVLATAPSFLLGGVVTLLILLVGRLSRVVDRAQILETADDADERQGRLKHAVPHLRRRAKMIHYAMAFALGSGIVTALLVVLAFGGARRPFAPVGVVSCLRIRRAVRADAPEPDALRAAVIG